MSPNLSLQNKITNKLKKNNSLNLNINDNPKPRKIINTRERENNKTPLLSMRVQASHITSNEQRACFTYLP